MALTLLGVEVVAEVAFLVMVETAAGMPVEPAKTEPTRPDTALVVVAAAEVVMAEMERRDTFALFTGAQIKCSSM